MKVYPAPGLKVRDPVTMNLLDENEGLEVAEFDLHWNRMLRDGDVVLTAPAKAKVGGNKE
ncbi:DUF2635 domain-containing protein [Burkholderia pseudomallei]|uniref:DUF2635 domain-containing protein n=1 Tax=Burkholderia pseudomallei TaxID=28450 RepID=UPI000977D640|nr:DUF2635 domain-containing protein [Burkholderia pseudomallei]OMQ57075.1 hypothetical protein AQ709_26600 [Burkholderia pseudomallei]OMQ65141.1 hypothetical protein AQ712_13010 [Burkholderia pseudomallei]OMQ72872.1 hypothetical protein AQ711_02470 [Burkholderia pseudomallei]CAJ2714079.1 Protein of uncharacterised function (DUF2635) [Burkholderia pseudomallei]CAJ4671771.1 Protein of uncharacterised function (DUF2635) [Burkholderia pseudomallei]